MKERQDDDRLYLTQTTVEVLLLILVGLQLLPLLVRVEVPQVTGEGVV